MIPKFSGKISSHCTAKNSPKLWNFWSFFVLIAKKKLKKNINGLWIQDTLTSDAKEALIDDIASADEQSDHHDNEDVEWDGKIRFDSVASHIGILPVIARTQMKADFKEKWHSEDEWKMRDYKSDWWSLQLRSDMINDSQDED